MTRPREAQLGLLLTISEGLSRGSHEMLRVSPTDAMHAPSCGLAIRDAVEELKWMRAEIERLNKDLLAQNACCDGAAAQDAHVRREREEHKAEVEKLRADNERLFNEDTKTRHALKGWVFVCPDGGDEPTHERVAAVVAEVEKHREENERLRAERDALRDAAREYLTTLGGAIKAGKFQMGGTAEMAHFVRQAMQKLDSLVFDREGPRPAGLEKLHEPLKRPS